MIGFFGRPQGRCHLKYTRIVNVATYSIAARSREESIDVRSKKISSYSKRCTGEHCLCMLVQNREKRVSKKTVKKLLIGFNHDLLKGFDPKPRYILDFFTSRYFCTAWKWKSGFCHPQHSDWALEHQERQLQRPLSGETKHGTSELLSQSSRLRRVPFIRGREIALAQQPKQERSSSKTRYCPSGNHHPVSMTPARHQNIVIDSFLM